MGLKFTTERINTENIVLRSLTLKDAQGLFEIRSNIKTTEYSGIIPYVYVDRAENFISNITKEIKNNRVSFWGISIKDNEDFIIGTICLMPYEDSLDMAEIGYELNINHTGKGIMAESMKVVIEYCINTLNLKCIYADTNLNNKPSIKLLESFGFKESEKEAINDFKYYYLNL